MYTVHEVRPRFPKEREIRLIFFANLLPDDTRVITKNHLLAKIWDQLQLQLPAGELSFLRRSLVEKMYKSVRNFDFLLEEKRTPTLGFLRVLQATIKKYGISLDLQQILQDARIKFGEGGNAASAQLPATLSPQLAYLVGAMRDGTLARSGKYEISISQRQNDWLRILKEIIMDLFHPSNEPAIRNHRVTLSNRPIFEYLHRVFEIPIGDKNNWGTPTIMQQAPLNLQKYYVRGFYDADGLSHHLGLCQVNKEAILFAKEALEKLGIKTGKLSVRKGKNHPLYWFHTARSSHQQFIAIIGSLNPSKQRLFLPLNKTS